MTEMNLRAWIMIRVLRNFGNKRRRREGCQLRMPFRTWKERTFPVDVWIKRIMETMYFDGVDTPKDKIAAFAKEQFGELGGFAQQYLFYYGKSIKMGVK